LGCELVVDALLFIIFAILIITRTIFGIANIILSKVSLATTAKVAYYYAVYFTVYLL